MLSSLFGVLISKNKNCVSLLPTQHIYYTTEMCACKEKNNENAQFPCFAQKIIVKFLQIANCKRCFFVLYYRRRGKEVRSDENLNLGFSNKSLGEKR